MLHIVPISLPSKSKDMEYSEDFKNMVKAHQGKFIGYGNPNAKILIIVPKIDDKRLVVYNGNNAEQWLANIESQTDFDDVKDFFVKGKQVGNESTFNPLHPFKGQRDIVVKKARNGAFNFVDGACCSWHLIQYLLSDLQWEFDDKINFFSNAFYTIFDEEMLKDSYFQKYEHIMYTFEDEDQFRHHDPVKLFGMKYYWGHQNKPKGAQRMIIYHKEGTEKRMMVTIAYEKAWKKNLERIKSYIDGYSRAWGIIDDSFIRKYIDKLAKGEISNPDSRKKACDYILKTISENPYKPHKWIDTWIYAIRTLKEEFVSHFMGCIANSLKYDGACHILASLFIHASHEDVRNIVTFLIKLDPKYCFTLSSTLHVYSLCPHKLVISKETYEELMNIFESIESVEIRTILIGKLLWLKYLYRDSIEKDEEWFLSV